MKRLQREPESAAKTRTIVKSPDLTDLAHASQALALETARAEFREAWQAKRQRAGRLRERAESVERVETWSARIGALVLLLAGCVALGCWGGGADPGSALWTGARAVRALWLACCVVLCFTRMTRMLLNRGADRLEAAMVRYEASSARP